MKKIYPIILSLLTCFLLVMASCSPTNNTPGFTNPGDQLGGGGIGEIANPIDTNSKEQTLLSQVDTLSLDELSTNLGSNPTTIEPSTSPVEISSSGTYLLSGSYTAGIKITKKDLNLHFILDGANISMTSGIAFDGADKKSKSLVLTIKGENTITNNGEDVNAIHIKGCDVGINGSGTLSVISDSKSAIKIAKNLQVVDCTLNLTAQSHAISCQSLTAQKAKITATSQKDGIHAECNDSTDTFTLVEGFVAMFNSDYTCSSFGDGIQADTFVYIDGGNIKIDTFGTYLEKSTHNMLEYELSVSDFRYIKSGSTYQKVADDYRGKEKLYALTQSCKAIKVGEIEYVVTNDDGTEKEVTQYNGDYLIMIKDGNFNINSSDDAIHANSGDIYVYQGKFEIQTLDDGLTADYTLKIFGGEIDITNCYEGLEGAQVEIYGGQIGIQSLDDGINAASDYNIDKHIIISGGKVTVDSVGDGLDSNGSILITGGEIVVFGPTSGADGGLDADKGIVVNGGTLFAMSTLGMVETPSSNSEQLIVSYAQKTTIQAGTNLYLTCGDKILYQLTTTKQCQTVIFSTPELKMGETYQLYGGETLLTKFTITSNLTSIGSVAVGNNPGGRPPRF